MGTYTAVDLYMSLSKIDQNFLEGISHLSGKQIESIADLKMKLDTYQTNWSGNLTDKVIDKLRGHVLKALQS